MAAEHKNDEVEYNSSSDEDYDPEKDTEIDPQDEIDDVEGGEEEPEDVEELKKEAKQAKNEEKSEKSAEDVDVDALFAELTGLDPTTVSSGAVEKKEEKVYPKTTTSEPSSSAKIYPEKPVASESSEETGLLDAVKSMKKSKTSVLEKSDHDWRNFKTEQNIKEDLESHNRGKGGYLNKMDFLNRTDNRQFEKEKAFRATARKDNGI
ncbi:unnamed protein product [Caenorhabditis sp. 36 PRJEB53466]|nr:unnamed protein product [Caenorhabditis sp. 36 PRJEB53466]